MACMNVCKVDAITVIESMEGFILPSIDENKCIHCGLCEAVCDFCKDTHLGNDIQRAFSFIHPEKDVVAKSSSGGAFTALSDTILEKNGVIVGVTYDNEFNVKHSIASTCDERDSMRGSKYVQSNPGLIYREIKRRLPTQPVLFVGTPCQCAGLKSYLGNDCDNLIVVDFLCHGVPSNKMFKEHINYVKGNNNGRVFDYSFRTKKYGWNSYANVITFAEQVKDMRGCAEIQERKKEDSSWLIQSFLTFFAGSMSLRPSCFNCPYRNAHRPSDITIGDFWQIEYLTGEKNKEGVSFVTANSQKGESFLTEVMPKMQMKEYSIEQVSFRLPNGVAKRPRRYDAFWDNYRIGGYKKVLQTYFDNSFKANARWELKKIAKRLRII